MLSLLNRIWTTLNAMFTALSRFIARTDPRLDSIESTVMESEQRLISIERNLKVIASCLTSIDTLLLNIDTTLDGTVDTLHEVRDGVNSILAEILPLPAARILFTFTLEGETSTGDYMKITSTQKFAAAVAPVDSKNNPALVDGKPVWEASAPTIISLVPSVDGLSVDVLAVGPIGSSQVSCTVDADLGSGVKTLTDFFNVDVVAGQAVGLGITVGEAVEQ